MQQTRHGGRLVAAIFVLMAMMGSVGVVGAQTAQVQEPGTSVFVPITPQRILDTRSGIGHLGMLGQTNLQVTGSTGVPDGATAVVMNVTATEATTGTYVAVQPAGSSPQGISNVNVLAGETQANLVTVKVGDGGEVWIFNAEGQVHVVADLFGYYVPGNGAPGPVGPAGPQGVAGPTGAAGAAGNTVLHGQGPPEPGTGANGDFYIDIDTSTLYGAKTGGSWPPGTPLVGPAGPAGLNGADGATGPAGLNGADGATGPMGPQGPIGPIGPIGPMGPQGLQGLDGPIGPQGLQGPAGLDGATGPMGPQGTAGLDGATGPMGPQGPAGLNGIDGSNGLDGATGPMGPQGPAGTGAATTWGYGYELAVDGTVIGGADVPFSNNGPLSGVTHTAGTTTFTVPSTGTYQVNYSISHTDGVGATIAIAVDGTVDGSTPVQLLTAAGMVSGSAMLTLAAGDVVTLRNNSAVALTMPLAPSVGAQLNINMMASPA